MKPSTKALVLALALLSPVPFALSWDADAADAADVDADAAETATGEAPPTEPVPAIANTEAGSVLLRVGLGAEALAAVGISPETTTSVVGAAVGEFETRDTALSAAEAAYETAKLRYDVLVRKVRSGLATSEELTECQSRKATADSQAAARDAMLDAIFDAGVDGLTTEQREALERIHANRSWYLPVEYLIVNRTQDAWVELGDALDVERIADQYGEEFPQEVQSYLAAVDATSEVATARTNRDTYHASVQTAWNAAVAD